MIIATVQAIGFFNSFNNPIVYAFMNENFKKSCFSTLSHCVRKPTQQSGAVAAPRLSVQFIKPQSREDFLEPDEGNSLEPHSAEKGPSTSSHGESSLEIMGEKISTIQTELPANSSSQVKWEGTVPDLRCFNCLPWIATLAVNYFHLGPAAARPSNVISGFTDVAERCKSPTAW